MKNSFLILPLLAALGAAQAQPNEASSSQYGDRQSGYFGDSESGVFGNPGDGNFTTQNYSRHQEGSVPAVPGKPNKFVPPSAPKPGAKPQGADAPYVVLDQPPGAPKAQDSKPKKKKKVASKAE